MTEMLFRISLARCKYLHRLYCIVDATCDCYANRGISFSTRKIVLLQGPVLRLVTSTSMGDKFCFVDKMSLRHVYVDQSSLSFHGILCNKFTVALTIGI